MWPNRILVKREYPDAATHLKRLRTPFVIQPPMHVSFCLVIDSPIKDNFKAIRDNLIKISQDKAVAEFIILTPQSSSFDHLKHLLHEFPELLKVYISSSNVDKRVLRNKCVELANGQVLFFLKANDQLSPRPVTFIFNQLTRSQQEEVLILKRLIGHTQRIGFLRNTFWEIGGFDERVSFDRQVKNLMKRFNRYGMPTLKIHMDHYTIKGEYFSFGLPVIGGEIKVSNDSSLNLEKLST